jgi:hypothetical protein
MLLFVVFGVVAAMVMAVVIVMVTHVLPRAIITQLWHVWVCSAGVIADSLP